MLADWAKTLEATCEAHVHDAHADDHARRRHCAPSFVELRERARKFAFEMDFTLPACGSERKLLSIGYRVEEHQLDESCYDLLASEARLTSLFAIAKGDLPTEHWFRLGRPIVEIGFQGALMSWSGSMFEYLMPPLVMKEPQGGILNQTNKLIVQPPDPVRPLQGRSVGHLGSRPTMRRDREMTYQYTNFGVPGLGLKRGLGAEHRDRALCDGARGAVHAGRSASTTCERLRKIGALGRYGYLRRRRLHAAARAGRHRPCRGATTTWPIIRACRSWRSPTRSSKAACATASTAIR